MSFFNKALSSIGIGSAKVDARISNSSIRAGEEIKGVIHIEGGNVEQQIDGIYISLNTEYIKEVDDKKVRQTAVIQKNTLTDSFTIQPKQTKDIPFSFVIPYDTPVSLKRQSVWVQTGLNVAMAIDPKDRDYLDVRPHRNMEVVLEAVTNKLGFYLRQVENEYSTRFRRHIPFVQEFEFVPQREFRGYLDELEMIFFVGPHDIEIVMEIDRKARGLAGFLSEAMDLDESRIRLTLTEPQLNRGSDYIAEYLQETIRRFI